MLKRLIYVTKQHKEPLSEKWLNQLKQEEIEFRYQTIEETLSRQDNKSEMICLCDTKENAYQLKKQNYFVIVICKEDNAQEDFTGFQFAVENFMEIEPQYYVKFWQRFMGLPWDILETNRCRLREIVPNDIDSVYELYQDKSVTKYMEDLYEDKENELDYLDKYYKNIYSYFGFGTWGVIRKEDQKMIGMAGYNYRPEFDEPELGFMFGVPYQKQGYAYEICNAIIQYGKNELGFTAIQALTESENENSIRLLIKLGFVLDKQYRIGSHSYLRYLLQWKIIEN